jgi:hypothetical protein
LGKWTSSDPGGFVDGLNLYVYVRNNPVNGVDALGYETEPPPVEKVYGTKVHKIQLEDGTTIDSSVSEENIATARPSETEPAESMSWWDIAKTVGEIAIGFTPLGVVQDVIDLGKAIASGDPKEIVMAGIGFIPGGDIIKGVKKATSKIPDDIAKSSKIIPSNSNKRVLPKGSPDQIDTEKVLPSIKKNGERSELFDEKKLEKIKKSLKKQGVDVKQNKESVEFLDKENLNAAYVQKEIGKPGAIYLKPNATKAEVVEELKHLGQHRRMKWADLGELEDIARLEIKTQQELITHALSHGWPRAEVKKLEEALVEWEGLLNKALKEKK